MLLGMVMARLSRRVVALPRCRLRELLAFSAHVPDNPAEKEVYGECAANKRQEIADIVHQFPLYFLV
jgi:hypothetical protein